MRCVYNPVHNYKPDVSNPYECHHLVLYKGRGRRKGWNTK